MEDKIMKDQYRINLMFLVLLFFTSFLYLTESHNLGTIQFKAPEAYALSNGNNSQAPLIPWLISTNSFTGIDGGVYPQFDISRYVDFGNIPYSIDGTTKFSYIPYIMPKSWGGLWQDPFVASNPWFGGVDSSFSVNKTSKGFTLPPIKSPYIPIYRSGNFPYIWLFKDIREIFTDKDSVRIQYNPAPLSPLLIRP
jgi:hypothetical protein